MFSSDLVSFLQSGCSLIVGSVSADGEPWAGRGWGLEVVDAVAGTFRLVIAGDDPVAHEHLATTGVIAVTGADVRSLRSVQVKGRVTSQAPATTADRVVVAGYCDAFFAAVAEVDDIGRELMDRLVPTELTTCEVVADDVFDQTPGPTAGAELGSRAR